MLINGGRTVSATSIAPSRVVSLGGWKRQWYDTEKQTSALLRAVLAARRPSSLSPDDIWCVLRLTWITEHDGEAFEGHWRVLKVPALAHLFRQKPIILEDLKSSIVAMQLPKAVTKGAVNETGIVNFRNVWRNSSRHWCATNHDRLIRIIRRASRLPSNDQARFELASEIDELPPIPSPNGATSASAAMAITPVVACLDAAGRFPIVNGRESVKKLLHQLRLANGDLEQQVKGMVNLVGQFGIRDALMLDVCGDEVAKFRPTIPHDVIGPPRYRGEEGSELPYLDEAERVATTKSGSIRYRDRHDRMTNGLKDILNEFELKRGEQLNCRYDVLVKNYDARGRDLLIEAKPDADRGAIRIAIGQLFDYRRVLPHRAGTDLAFATILRPPQSYVDLLLDLQISVLWFNSEACTTMSGDGKAWASVQKALNC